MSTGVRMAWVKEQHTAPARAYLEYRAIPSSWCIGLAVGGSDMYCGDGVSTAVMNDDSDEEACGTDDCPVML